MWGLHFHNLVTLLVLSYPLSIIGEMFTAVADMEGLLWTEGELLQTLSSYLHDEEIRLRRLRMHMEKYEKLHEKAIQDTESYLSNPINAYLLVKRLTTDWKEVEDMMTHNTGETYVANLSDHREVLKFPSDDDLHGAAVALMRLQDTYKLDTAAVARGELNGKQYGIELTAGDCFELGRQTYNAGDYYHTVLWMTEALQRHQEEYNQTARKEDILEYLAFSTYMEGDVHHALELTNDLLHLTPNHQRALGNKQYYEEALTTKKVGQKRGETGENYDSENSINIPQKDAANHFEYELSERQSYEMLCRGEKQLDKKIAAKLKCRYVDSGQPFLKLQPFKEEEAYLKPRIVLYHDVMFDSEIETIKKLAQPRFSRATVQNYKTGELETASYRISKSAWLRKEDHRHIVQVCQRIEDLTGLNMDTAEELQVANYGIGGHYEPHFDFARKEETNAFKSLGTGNRIATFLFYMSDVEQGGATVFPGLGVSLWPKKATAAFWYNLYKNGEGNYLMRHAACPVLLGTKWVSNKWIHERGQEFRRPCGIKADE